MYIKDLLKKIATKNGIPIIIYLVLNVLITGFMISLFQPMFGMEPANLMVYYGIGAGVYLLSVILALSPFGEMIIRLQSGCRRMKEVESEFIQDLFNEVYAKAKQADPLIGEGVQLFIVDDQDPRVSAIGRKTVYVTKGMLELPANQVEAALAREFGHIALKDTDLIMLVTVGNLIFSAVMIALRMVIWFIQFCFSIAAVFIGGSEGIVAALSNLLVHFLTTIVFGCFMKAWTKIGELLVIRLIRNQDIMAEQFAASLKLDDCLCAQTQTPQETSFVYCKNCGTRVSTDTRFCPECGSVIIVPSVLTETKEKCEETKKEIKKGKSIVKAAVALVALVLIAGSVIGFKRNDYEASEPDYTEAFTPVSVSETDATYDETEPEDESQTVDSEYNPYEEEDSYEYTSGEEFMDEEPEDEEFDDYSSDDSYNDEYVFSDSDIRLIAEWELDGLDKFELDIARNEIFARHGRMFNRSDLQNYFDSCSWYSGCIAADVFSVECLNDVEKANAELILNYEKEMGYIQ